MLGEVECMASFVSDGQFSPRHRFARIYPPLSFFRLIFDSPSSSPRSSLASSSRRLEDTCVVTDKDGSKVVYIFLPYYKV